MIDPNKFSERQRILANFGDFVLDHDDLDEILNEACRLIAQALDTDFAKVIEIEPGNGTGLVRAGVGWRPGIVGHERVSLGERSSEAFAIEMTEPVITNDIAQEERFVFPAFLRDHGVVAIVNVPILLPGRVPYGILQVDHCARREFDKDDVQFLKTYAMVLGPVIDRLKTAAALKATDERLRLIVDNARAYVMVVSDADDRITDWLGGSEAILGWSPAEAIGQRSEMFFTHEDRAAGVPERELCNARENGAAANIRCHRRKDGSQVFLDGQTIALREQGGKLRGYLKIAQDFTDRKQAEDRQGFLIGLSDALRPLTTVAAVTALAATGLGKQLDANRVVYGTIANGVFTVEHDYARDVPSIVGDHTIAPFERDFLAVYRSGALVAVDEIETDSRLDEAGRAALRGRDVVAFADHVLFDESDLITILGVQSATPRVWTASEKTLIREVGERLKTAIDRARAETALRHSEARLRQFGEASSDVLWSRDAETLQWDYLSPAFETVYGMPVDQALAGDNLKNWTDLIVEDDRAHALASLERVRAGEQTTFEFRIQRPDGGIRWLRDTDFPIYGPDGRIVRFGGIGQDVTEVKQAQHLLEESEERLRHALEVGRQGLWDWNVATGHVHWSDEHYRLEGYAVGAVVPSYDLWLAGVHPDDRADAEAVLHRAMDQHTDFIHEFRVVHPDGSVHWLDGRGRFFYDDHGQPQRMVGAMIETTERREWSERQNVLVAELQHRTRNLIALVRSTAEKTARGSADLGDFRVRFRDRLEALARVQGLLSRLNDVDRVTFDDLIRTELSAMTDTLDRVTLTGPADIRLRSSTVQTLAMALHELATNAVKYGALGQPDAHLTVTWSLEPTGADGRPWLHVEWRESGVAMHAASTTSRGTGQGRELIERALPYQLGAKTSYTLGAEGVRCTISIPVSRTTTEGLP
ncbi:PAS domain-containing protein [Sphingomonas sp. PB2P19]|uniref:PAS domain-containing protein n=1 Tax=Sphingomonas rhamnosi TaxID=3096156 RepID=UPI002FC86E50